MRAQTHLPSLLEKLSRIVSSAMEAEAISLEEGLNVAFTIKKELSLITKN